MAWEASGTAERDTALLMLEHEGYVISEPRRGTFVTRLAREEALDLCYNRALLESFAVRTGYARIDHLASELARLGVVRGDEARHVASAATCSFEQRLAAKRGGFTMLGA